MVHTLFPAYSVFCTVSIITCKTCHLKQHGVVCKRSLEPRADLASCNELPSRPEDFANKIFFSSHNASCPPPFWQFGHTKASSALSGKSILEPVVATLTALFRVSERSLFLCQSLSAVWLLLPPASHSIDTYVYLTDSCNLPRSHSSNPLGNIVRH